MRWEMLALPVALTLGVFSQAMAQSAGPPSAPTSGSRQIKFRAGVTGEYHSNVAQTGSSGAAARGLEPEDWIARPNVHIDAIQPIGRNALYVQGNVGYSFYRNNTRLNTSFADVSGGGITNLNVCQASAYGGYHRAQSELGDLAGGIVRNILTRRSVGLSLDCGRSTGFNSAVTVGREWRSNSAPLIQESNGDTDTASVAIGYANHSLGQVQVLGAYSQGNSPYRLTSRAPGAVIGESVTIRSLGASYEKDIGPKLKVNAQASRTFVKRSFSPAGVKPKFESNTYGGSIAYKASSRLDFGLSANRAVKPSTGVGKLYDKETNSALVVHYKFGTRLDLTVGAQRADTASNNDGVLAALTFTKSRRDSVYGTVTYRRGDLGSISLEVRQTQRDTNQPSFNYSDTRVGLTLDASF